MYVYIKKVPGLILSQPEGLSLYGPTVWVGFSLVTTPFDCLFILCPIYALIGSSKVGEIMDG